MSRPICQDCEDPIPKGQRRMRCKRCGLLICSWCDHHIHGPERDAAVVAAARAPSVPGAPESAAAAKETK